MAFPSVLLNQVASDVGSDSTALSADRIQSLVCLNRAYKQISQSHPIKMFGSFTPNGIADVLLSSFGATNTFTEDKSSTFSGNFLAVDYVWYRTDATTAWYPNSDELPRYTLDETLRFRAGTNSYAAPTCYSLIAGVLHFDSMPQSTAAGAVMIYGSLAAAALTDAATDQIVGINEAFHEDLLGNLATAIMLEGYEGEELRAATFRRNADAAMVRFNQARMREGGLDLQSFPTQNFSTPVVVRRR